jgi:hypothetical protein
MISAATVRTPNFFVAGAPKAGTTSLYHYLDQHPQIYLSPIKEPNYFAGEMRFENFCPQWQRMAAGNRAALAGYLQGPATAKFSGGPVPEWGDYLRLFQSANGHRAIGEASVCYLWSPTAPERIAARFPAARIITILRDPVERAFSQHVHALMSADRPMSFREHVDAGMRATGSEMSESYPFLHFGRYGEQIERYLQFFPREQVRVVFYDDYQANPAGLLRGLFEFLGVDAGFTPDFTTRHMVAKVPRSYAVNRSLKAMGLWQAGRRLLPAALRSYARRLAFRRREAFRLDPADRQYLLDFYREDIRKLSGLLNRDLSSWLA